MSYTISGFGEGSGVGLGAGAGGGFSCAATGVNSVGDDRCNGVNVDASVINKRDATSRMINEDNKLVGVGVVVDGMGRMRLTPWDSVMALVGQNAFC